MKGGKRVVVLGGRTGLLGQALCRELTHGGYEVFAPIRSECDIFSEYSLSAYLDSCQPDILFNTVAYTQVDKAEVELEEATRVNEGFCATLASVLKTRPCTCMSFSTDFVFDGRKSFPYSEDDVASPMSVYGKTKLAGERKLLDVVPEKTIIARTAWLFGCDKINFVQKILWAANEKDILQVVADQIGSPTFTSDLAKMCVKLVNQECTGVFHLVNLGKASWYELAAAAVKIVGAKCTVLPVFTKELSQRAPRPSYSVLNNQKYMKAVGDSPRGWQAALLEYLTLVQEK